MIVLKSLKEGEPRKKRPAGVTVVAILEVLGGFGALAFGNIVTTISAMINEAGGEVTGRVVTGFGILGSLFAVVGGLIGGILYLVGIVDFFIAYGLLKGSCWAWTLCLVFSIIGIALGIVLLPIGIISIIANVVIAYYLTRLGVKQFFGKAALH